MYKTKQVSITNISPFKVWGFYFKSFIVQFNHHSTPFHSLYSNFCLRPQRSLKFLQRPCFCSSDESQSCRIAVMRLLIDESPPVRANLMFTIKFFAADFHPKFALWAQQFCRSASNKSCTHVTHTQLLKSLRFYNSVELLKSWKFYFQTAKAANRIAAISTQRFQLATIQL